ncbi:hypothetical protein J4731_02035 [Providencia rettgeri]|nr:hypothetical protein [Providencia rettgeri]
MATTPRWLTYWLGGLNHIYTPFISELNHRHYPALAKIIEQTAEQFSMDYHCISAKELFVYQQQFLKEMERRKRMSTEPNNPVLTCYIDYLSIIIF